MKSVKRGDIPLDRLEYRLQRMHNSCRLATLHGPPCGQQYQVGHLDVGKEVLVEADVHDMQGEEDMP